MKAKVILDSSRKSNAELQSEINEFLADKEIVEIKIINIQQEGIFQNKNKTYNHFIIYYNDKKTK